MAPPRKVIGTAQQYEVEKTIASGAFSRVYRCRDRTTGQRYAAKVVSKTVVEKYRMTETLQREADAMRRIGTHCPYVVKFVDAFVSPHNYYFIMGLAEGGTLLDYARTSRKTQATAGSPSAYASRGGSGASSPACSVSGPISRVLSVAADELDKVAFYTKQLLLGLKSIHASNVVHRDIKPENLLLNKSRTRLLISDFGFACYAPETQVLHRACGTLRYCAPELLDEDPCYDGRKVDVWAAGVTVYVLLFKAHPYRPNKCVRGKSAADDFLDVILQAEYTLPKSVPAEVEDFLQKALTKDPAERWSVAQLLDHPWMTAVELAPTSDDDEVLGDASELSRTTMCSMDNVGMARAASTASLSSLAAHRTHSAWDSLMEVDDGFYEASQMRQSSCTGMSDSQEGGVRSVTAGAARHSPSQLDSDGTDGEADSPYVSAEWAAAGSGRVHAAYCPQGGHPTTNSGRAVRVLQVACFTVLNVILYAMGRLCRALGFAWCYPPNAEDHFAAVDAAIAAQSKAAQGEDSFDGVFDNLFDGDLFGDAFASFSAGPRLVTVLDETEAVDLTKTRRPSQVSRQSTEGNDEPQGCTPHENQRIGAVAPSPLHQGLSSPTQTSDMINKHLVAAELATDCCDTDHNTPCEDLVCLLNSPHEDESPLRMDLPCSPSAPLPSSQGRRQIEDFPSTTTPNARARD